MRLLTPGSTIGRPVRRVVLAVACILTAGLCALDTPSRAQSPDEQAQIASGSAYVTPFPPGDIYKLQVYGDGLAENLLAGLTDQGRALDRVDLPKKHRAIPPLVRTEAEDEIRAEDSAREIVHIAAVVVGLNDRASLRVPGASALKFGTAEWKEQYGRRFDKLLKALKRRNIAVYVLGMPPLRRQDANSDAETVNEILLERAQANGIRFIEVAESFTDENGAFSQFGPDASGNREKLRDGDGVGFTASGNRKLASLLVAEVKRDLAAARAERAVPLAGTEAEQRRVNPEKAAVAAWKGVVNKDGKETRSAQATPVSPVQAAVAAARGAGGQGDLKAENSRLSLKFIGINGREEIATLDIVRPPVAAAVIALLQRKETAEQALPSFELLVDDVGDGVSVSTMVTALPEAAGLGRRRGAAIQSNYTTVWVKGDRLPPKPGRADDFSWPRVDVIVLPPASAAIAGAPTASVQRKSQIPEVQLQLPRVRPLAGPGQKG